MKMHESHLPMFHYRMLFCLLTRGWEKLKMRPLVAQEVFPELAVWTRSLAPWTFRFNYIASFPGSVLVLLQTNPDYHNSVWPVQALWLFGITRKVSWCWECFPTRRWHYTWWTTTTIPRYYKKTRLLNRQETWYKKLIYTRRVWFILPDIAVAARVYTRCVVFCCRIWPSADEISRIVEIGSLARDGDEIHPSVFGLAQNWCSGMNLSACMDLNLHVEIHRLTKNCRIYVCQ